MTDKQKLTLSVDSKVVEQAKDLNLNISEITEQVLKGFTFEPKAEEGEALLNKYKELFKIMLQPLKKFRGSVEVGSMLLTFKDTKGKETVQQDNLYLLYDGSFYSDVFNDESIFDIERLTTKYVEENHITFCFPQELLSNFIDGLVKGAERQKETIKELEATKRIIEAVSSTLFSKTAPQQTGIKRKPKAEK
jgi:hypothetical protein